MKSMLGLFGLPLVWKESKANKANEQTLQTRGTAFLNGFSSSPSKVKFMPFSIQVKFIWSYVLASRAPPFSSWVICRFVSVHVNIALCFSGHTWLQLRLRLPHWDVSVQSVEVEAKQFGLGLADILFPPDDGMTFKIAHAVQVMESVSSELHIAIGKFADHIYNRSVSFFYLWHLVVTRNKHA